jgi:putative hemolysin
VTFRAVGEGTGRALDLDRFDWYYQHLFVWNARKQELVGAYRLQGSDETSDLYTRTLFQYDERFLKRMGPALELGRSFVRAEYQRGFAPLLLLWKGIGKLVARHPRYKTLFGPVSISNQYQAVSRELMLAFLEKRASLDEWTGLVRARHAPTRERRTMVCNDLDELSEVVSDVDPAQAGVPVLLRQYLRLGGRLLGFSVDPAFSDALDGLIVVDLTRTEPKLRERYLGKDEAAVFLAFHNTFNSNRADHDAA